MMMTISSHSVLRIRHTSGNQLVTYPVWNYDTNSAVRQSFKRLRQDSHLQRLFNLL
jgi:hypothetical protein